MKAETVINEFFNRKFGIKKTSTWYKTWKREKMCPLYIWKVEDFGVSLGIKSVGGGEDTEYDEEAFFGAWIDIDDLILL